MKHLLLLVILVSSLSVCAQFQIGHTTITFNDPTRSGGFGSGGGSGRQIQTEIYYPCAVAGENVTIANGQFPIIVFGHGFAMAWDAYSNIWEHYAPLGYIIAFPRTEGNLFPAPSHNDFALDLSLVSSKLLALTNDPQSIFYQSVNGNAAIMGHSMGGGASFLAASNNSGIKTVVGLAPAETNPSAITASQNVTVPALIFSGSSDGVTPPADHHQPIYNGLGSACKSFVSIIGGAHCYFANSNFNCDFGESTSSSGISISRTQQQLLTFERLDPWFSFHLKMNCTSYSDFQSVLVVNQSQATGVSTCAINPIPTISQSGNNLSCSVTGYAYQWFIDGVAIPQGTTQTISINQNGTYTVQVQFNAQCEETSLPFVVASLGMNELTNSINIYPVPFEDQLIIDGIEVDQEVSIIQLDGAVVFKGKYEELKGLSHLSRGAYIVCVENWKCTVIK